MLICFPVDSVVVFVVFVVLSCGVNGEAEGCFELDFVDFELGVVEGVF